AGCLANHRSRNPFLQKEVTIMGLRNWWRSVGKIWKRSARAAAPNRRAFQPQLEGLEERAVPNASRVWDGAGNPYLFVVYRNPNDLPNSGDLWRYDASGAHFLNANISSVHAFKDPQGPLGYDVVFASVVPQPGSPATAGA